MRRFLSIAVHIADVLSFVLYALLIIQWGNLFNTAAIVFMALVTVCLLKSLSADEETKVVFNKGEFLRRFFTETLIKFVVMMVLILWSTKWISTYSCFAIILLAFILQIFIEFLCYWILENYKLERQDK